MILPRRVRSDMVPRGAQASYPHPALYLLIERPLTRRTPLSKHTSVRTARVVKGYSMRGVRCSATITARWEGGMYVDLSFNGAPSSEVINLMDYANDTRKDLSARCATRAELLAWIEQEDNEETDWAASQEDDEIERAEIRAQYRRRHPRAWLAAYVANA